MSERRSLPPMQYAPPEDGHANHDAIRPESAARFQYFSTVECAATDIPKLARLYAENSGAMLRVRCRDRQMADIMRDMVTNRSSTKRGKRMSVRLSGALLGELEASAEREHRPLSDLVRDILIKVAAEQVVRRAQQEGNDHV